MTFTTNGLKVTVTAWYVNGSGTLQQGTLGQYSNGLGICYGGVSCSGTTEEVNNSGNDEFLLFQFSAPVDPTSITLKSTSKTGMGVSYWLGSNTSQSMSLTNMSPTGSLSTLGFGSANNSSAGSGTTRTVDFGGAPSTSVNAILFGTMYGYSGDAFDVSGFAATTLVSVPEPASIFFLLTIIVAGLKIHRDRRALKSTTVKRMNLAPASRGRSETSRLPPAGSYQC